MKNIDAVLQYLDWALIAAHAEANPDCREVFIRLSLEQKVSTTSYVPKGAPPESDVNSELLRACETVHTALTGPKDFNRDGCIKMLYKAMRFAQERGVRVPKTTALPANA